MRRAIAVLLALACAGPAAAGMRVTAGGTGADAWFLFEPTQPAPVSAPLVVITHGYYEFSGYASMRELIAHTADRGNVVIYPRWQTGIAAPCPGPFDIEPCMSSEVNGIKGALAFLKAHPRRIQPQLSRTSYFGFSFGGIITANLANRWKALGVPQPRAIFLDDPHDGGLIAGQDEPALDDSLAGIPPTTLVQCHSGAQGVIAEPAKANQSCNAVFPKLTSVPAARKDLVLTEPDSHGSPALSSAHGVCAGSPPDTYDRGFCWKVFDALRSCAYAQVNCHWALGNTPEHRYIGTWSDGVPTIGLKIQDAGPIAPKPVPARQSAPADRPAVDRPPHARVTRVTHGVIRGTAADDHGVASVAVAIVKGCCRRPTSFVRAHGTRRWSLRLPRALGPGRRHAVVLVTDSAGQQRLIRSLI